MAHILNPDQPSFMKSRWVLPDADIAAVEQIVRQFNIPEVVARLLCVRGVAPDDVAGFLYPTLREHFPDPLSLHGMKAMAQDAAKAIESGKQIAIFGDFDVDGATSSAILHKFLKHCGIEARIYIPERLTEGYGPNEEALRTLKDEGADVLFMLDCGTTAFDTISAGRDMGLEIIILDHHEAEENLPPAMHLINPKRKDDTSGLNMLAAVGVTFMACIAINGQLRENGFYTRQKISEPSLKDDLDLVALGTVCDMVPLTGVNRLMVRQGFMLMNQTKNTGLKALIEVSGLNGPLGPYHAGFVLGPRINAGSRVHKSDLGAKLLSTLDAEEAKNIAWLLNDCNDKRKAIQIQMEEQAIGMVEAQDLMHEPVIIVGHADWHAGLSGLVAGRLKEKYDKPACVVTYTDIGNGVMEGRGSGRSVPGIHIAQAFIDARQAGLLIKGGGHAMAGGFTIAPDKLEEFKAFIRTHVLNQAGSRTVNVETVIDGLLSVRGARTEFIKMIHDHVGPFGQEHPEPLFLLQNVRIHSADIVGGSHIRTMISDWEGGARMKAMAFRAVGTDLGDALLKQGTQAFDLTGYLKIDSWGGQERVEMHIKDGILSASASAFMTDQKQRGGAL
jgi:single-stranded-DNA-specific exonuclease